METFFKSIINELKLNENNTTETTRRQKAQHALQNKNRDIKTMCILSAENPMSKQLSSAENKARRVALEIYLKNANYAWFRIKGKYGNDEKSHIIYNISLNDACQLGKKFQQESIIFIYVDFENESAKYYYLEMDENGEYVKTHERENYIMMDDADDFYSAISRAFKFQIPFFDGSDEIKTEIAEQIDYLQSKISNKCLSEERKNKYLNTLLDESKTGKSKYESRGNLFGGWNPEV